MATFDERQQAWEDFLLRWPLRALNRLIPSTYNKSGDQDTFTYWLEFGPGRLLGSIKGGDSSKLGLYERKNEPKGPRVHVQAGDVYSWKKKYGTSVDEAFATIRSRIVEVAKAASKGDIERIQEIDLEHVLKWKVAFIYQDANAPCVLPIYNYKSLCVIAGETEKRLTQADLYARLLKQRGEKPVLAYGFELWSAMEDEPVDQELSDGGERESDTKEKACEQPLNQILFGPPGTGKTYNTINQALSILAPEVLAQNCGDNPESRKRLKTEFDRFVAAERVRFLTFHQSFSYEDFVEGLRAVNDEATGQLRYEVVDGVFKQMCQLQLTCPSSQANELPKLTQRILSFRFGSSGKHEADIASVIEGRLLELDRQDVKSGDLILVTDGIRFLRAVGVVTHCGFPEEGKQTGRMEARVSWLKVLTPPIPLHEVVPNPSPVHQTYFLKSDRITLEALQGLLSEPGLMVNEVQVPEPKVLIIDEINRGNVSRIFGELITLIERSKRAGADEALSVVLPYSKQRFSVPSNVYLIGTMNTADRSLAGLDIALRRRFTFKEMLPDHQLLKGVSVEGINIGELLAVMNQRIEVLLDRDHCLGHAYFMSLKSGDPLERLESIFRNQILPLLQEYFFEDWQRIQWVLNDHRKPAADRFVEQSKPDLNNLFGSTVTGVQGGIWRVMPGAFTRASAYAGIIAVKPELQAVAIEVAVVEEVD